MCTWMLLMLSTTALQVLAIVRMVSALEMRSLCHSNDDPVCQRTALKCLTSDSCHHHVLSWL
jgi:hypothetical protein